MSYSEDAASGGPLVPPSLRAWGAPRPLVRIPTKRPTQSKGRCPPNPTEEAHPFRAKEPTQSRAWGPPIGAKRRRRRHELDYEGTQPPAGTLGVSGWEEGSASDPTPIRRAYGGGWDFP
jgi:hypothetical protein